MKEVTLTLPDKTYERLVADAASAHKSPEQWIIDRLFTGQSSYMAEPHILLAAAFDALGFKRLEPEKAQRLSELLYARKERLLSPHEVAELNTLMAEADALELESLQRLAVTER
ncbi:MAG: hypothetical protein ACRERD_31715 [Candidatus Binatia bacterium]